MTHSSSERPAMNEPLLNIRNLLIDGESDEVWHEIIKGLDLTLNRGEVLGLIGESGAGKSTLGLAAMNFVRPGCRIRGGTIRFDGEELTKQSETDLRKLRGVRIAYVAQSAAASFNPAHQLIDQFSEIPVVHGVKNRQDAEADAKQLYRRVLLPDPEGIGSVSYTHLRAHET